MKTTCDIVLVDDDEMVLELERESLIDGEFSVKSFTSPLLAWDYIRANPVRLVVTDWEMPGMSGMDLLFKVRGMDRPPHVILITGYGNVNRAVQAMSSGAYSFLEKPFDPSKFVTIIRKALSTETSDAPPPVTPPTTTGGPVVQSAAMRKVFDMARNAAGTDSSILLLGESGTGKEVLADHIHRNSRRANGPLVKVNCGALPEHLMESELFGHEKGAFTGADRRRIGRFEQADNGTLFLDEIGDLLLPLQVKLLRALQERTIERLGSSTPVNVNIRLVCATHRDLREAVRQGSFREDLYYRINVVPVRLLPLRERPDDIEPLARHFLKEMRSAIGQGPQNFSPEAFECLRRFHWPGNVRQLRNAVEYTLVVCGSSEIMPCDLPEEVRESRTQPMSESRQSTPMDAPVSGASSASPAPAAPATSGSLDDSVDKAEHAAILAALELHRWKVVQVARELKISRSRLYERMKFFGIKRPGT